MIRPELPYFARVDDMKQSPKLAKWNAFLGYHATGFGQRIGDPQPLPTMAQLANRGLFFLREHGFPECLVRAAARHVTFEQEAFNAVHTWRTHMDATDCDLEELSRSLNDEVIERIATSMGTVFQHVRTSLYPNWFDRRRLEWRSLPYRIRVAEEEERMVVTMQTCHLPMHRTFGKPAFPLDFERKL